jgi:hypothetical protein
VSRCGPLSVAAGVGQADEPAHLALTLALEGSGLAQVEGRVLGHLEVVVGRLELGLLGLVEVVVEEVEIEAGEVEREARLVGDGRAGLKTFGVPHQFDSTAEPGLTETSASHLHGRPRRAGHQPLELSRSATFTILTLLESREETPLLEKSGLIRRLELVPDKTLLETWPITIDFTNIRLDDEKQAREASDRSVGGRCRRTAVSIRP